MPGLKFSSMELPDSAAIFAETLVSEIATRRFGREVCALHRCSVSEALPIYEVRLQEKLIGQIGETNSDLMQMIAGIEFVKRREGWRLGAPSDAEKVNFYEYDILSNNSQIARFWFNPGDEKTLKDLGLEKPSKVTCKLELVVELLWNFESKGIFEMPVATSLLIRADQLGGDLIAYRCRTNALSQYMELQVGGSMTEDQISLSPRIILGKIGLTIEELQLLRPGTVLAFEMPTEVDVTLELGGQSIAKGLLKYEGEKASVELTEI